MVLGMAVSEYAVSTLKLMAVVVILFNYKSWPLVYHIRSYFAYRKGLERLREKQKNLFYISVQNHRLWPDDMDINFHMNNSSYNKLLDYARYAHVTGQWGTPLIKKELFIHNAGIQTFFKKEIPPFAKFLVETRLLTWNEKWMFLIHRFVLAKTKVTSCICTSKLVFKQPNGKTVKPEDVFELCGYVCNSEQERQLRDMLRDNGMKYAESILQMDGLFEESELWNENQLTT
ncbi:611_t:CDS:2 [Paraglomus occultum]|uniref:611_t:CDS:1 n=1 Tax=Paraglomus occultum TaxID=144539 RepID=A0A9N8Z9W2_9GLOM|nr:611_t:CDS:2 [Paraglomus occultum]